MSRIGTLGLAAAGRLVHMPPVPDIPDGRIVELPGRGSTYVVDTGPVMLPGTRRPAPTVFLLHALACTGLLTWYPCLPELRRHYRLVIPDLRWHGQGIRSPRFSLEDCADDVAAVADQLGIDRFISAGYSMGSLTSQLVWHRHRDRVSGLVLAASSACFATTPRRMQAVESVGGRLALIAGRKRQLALTALDQTRDDRWAWRQFRATTNGAVTAAAMVIARFDSREWIGDVDVPTAVVVMTRDRVIFPHAQRDLADRIGPSSVHEADAGHSGCVLSADRFRPAFVAGVDSVAERLPARRPARRRSAQRDTV